MLRCELRYRNEAPRGSERIQIDQSAAYVWTVYVYKERMYICILGCWMKSRLIAFFLQHVCRGFRPLQKVFECDGTVVNILF